MYDIMFSDEHHGMMETDRRCCRNYQNRKKSTMIASNVRVRSIELSMPSIEAFRRDIVAIALQARDMILGPRRYVADDLYAAIEAINTMIRTHSSVLVGNWVTAYVRPVGGQPQLLTTYAIREVSSEPL
jgi:hypothetical protein